MIDFAQPMAWLGDFLPKIGSDGFVGNRRDVAVASRSPVALVNLCSNTFLREGRAHVSHAAFAP